MSPNRERPWKQHSHPKQMTNVFPLNHPPVVPRDLRSVLPSIDREYIYIYVHTHERREGTWVITSWSDRGIYFSLRKFIMRIQIYSMLFSTPNCVNFLHSSMLSIWVQCSNLATLLLIMGASSTFVYHTLRYSITPVMQSITGEGGASRYHSRVRGQLISA